MTEQESESTGFTSDHQRRLGELEGYTQDDDSRLEALLAPPEPNGSFNVVSQGTENANDASTYRQDARPASDNSGRRGGTSLGNSQRSQTERDSKRNHSSASLQSFMQRPKSHIQILGMSVVGGTALGFGQSITSSVIEFWRDNLSGTTMANLGTSMISSTSSILSSSSYSMVATMVCALLGIWKIIGSTGRQKVSDIFEVIGLTKEESNLVSEDLQVSNLSDLVQINEPELRESLLRNGLLSNRIERIVRSFTAFRLKWTSLPDSEKMSFRSNSYTSLEHSKWIERLEVSRVPRSPKTFDFGSLPSPIESASSLSKKKVDFAIPINKVEDTDSSESEDSDEDSSDDDDFELFYSSSAARSVQAKKNPMPSIPCDSNKKEKYDMQAKNDLSTAGVLALIDEVSPLQEPVWNGGPKKGSKWKKYRKEKLMYLRGNDWLKSYFLDSALASNHPLCKHLSNVVDGREAYKLVQTHLDPVKTDKQTAMLKALDSFLKVQLTSLSKGSFTKFALSYQNAIDRMTAAGLNLDPDVLKILLYSKLPRETYGIVFSKLKDFESLDLLATIQAIADQALHIENGSSKGDSKVRVNATSSEKNTKSSVKWPAKISGHKVDTKTGRISAADYKHMSWQERKDFFDEKKKLVKENPKLKLSDSDRLDDSKIQIHFLMKKNGKAAKSKDTMSFDDAKECVLNLVEKKNGSEDAKKLKGWMERKVGVTMSVPISSARISAINADSGSSFVIVDGGADTGLQGKRTSAFIEHTNRSVKVTGFDDREVSEDLPIGTSVSKVMTKNGEEVILLANEQIDHRAQDNSVFSVNQLRAFNVDVDDCPAMYERDGVQGRQSMIVEGEIEIPFMYENNLLLLEAAPPTNEELERLPILVVTSAAPWDPRTPTSTVHPIRWSPSSEGDSGIIDEDRHTIIRNRFINQLDITYAAAEANDRPDVLEFAPDFRSLLPLVHSVDIADAFITRPLNPSDYIRHATEVHTSSQESEAIAEAQAQDLKDYFQDIGLPVDDSDDDSVPGLLDQNNDDSSAGSGEREVPQCRDDYIPDLESLPSVDTNSHGSGNAPELSFSFDSEGGSIASDRDSLVSDDSSLDSEYIRHNNHIAFGNQRSMGSSMAPRDWNGSDVKSLVDSLLTRLESVTVVPSDESDYETLSDEEEITLASDFGHMMDNDMTRSVLTSYDFGELYSDSSRLERPFHEASINNILAYTRAAGSIAPRVVGDVRGATSYLPHARELPANTDWALMARRFGYSSEAQMKATYKVTTQYGTASVRYPQRRHFKSRFPFMNVNRIHETFSTDTMFSTVPALDGSTAMQLFVGNTSDLVAVYGMQREAEGITALQDFLTDFGAPHAIRRDNSKMQNSDAWRKVERNYNIKQELSEPHNQQQNPAERMIQTMKSDINIMLDRTNAPKPLWLVAGEYLADIHNARAQASKLKGRNPTQSSLGYTVDISAYLMFEWFEKVFVLDMEDPTFPNSKEVLGHFVGVAKNTGDLLTFKIYMPKTKTIIHRSVVRPADGSHPNERARNPHYDGDESGNDDDYSADSDSDDDDEGDDHGNDDGAAEEADSLITPPPSPSMFSTRNNLAKDDPRLMDCTTGVVNDPNDVIGFQFPYEGQRATVIAESADEKGKYLVELLDGQQKLVEYNLILDHYEAGEFEEDRLYVIRAIRNHRKKGQKWELLIEWDGPFANTWEPMSTLKVDDPITVASYGVEKGLTDLNGWKWCKKVRLIDPSRMIMHAKTIFAASQSTDLYKHGVRVPRGIRQAQAFDNANGDTKWMDAFALEVQQLVYDFETFEVLKRGDETPAGHQRIPLIIVFDNKFDGRRKCRIVGGGHVTAPPAEDVYSSVVSMESIRFVLFLAEKNRLKVWAGDVGNAYLNGTTREKLYVVFDSAFGPDLAGRVGIVRKSLYGLKTSCARWSEHLADTLRSLNWVPSKAHNDVWMKDCGTHYEYVAIYSDDVICASRKPEEFFKLLQTKYAMKGVGVPEYYLGASVSRIPGSFDGSSDTAALSAKTYIKNMIPKLEEAFGEIFRSYTTPIDPDYRPELDESELCGAKEGSLYRMAIGSMQWVVNLGGIDIQYTTTILSKYGMCPRQGHLVAVKRALGYVKCHPKGKIVFDTRPLEIQNVESFTGSNWRQIYGDIKEELPPDMPEPKMKEVTVTIFFDASHADDLVTRRSMTGIIVFFDSTPVRWYCKKQATIESSTYGSEIVAGRISTEMGIEMRYSLRMLGVPVKEVRLLGDNRGMIQNCSIMASQLKKKHNAIAYHRIREAVAGEIITLGHIPTDNNLSDILTKALRGPKLHSLTKELLFRAIDSGECEDKEQSNLSLNKNDNVQAVNRGQ